VVEPSPWRVADAAVTAISALSLHDALPIYPFLRVRRSRCERGRREGTREYAKGQSGCKLRSQFCAAPLRIRCCFGYEYVHAVSHLDELFRIVFLAHVRVLGRDAR